MPDVILKDQYGEDVTYPDVDTVLLNTEGGTATYVSEHLIQNQAQADWNQTDDTQVDYIKNKPEIPSIEGLATITYVDEQIASIDVSSGNFEQIQSDWDETDTTSPAYIKNKPTISGDGGTSVQVNWEQTDESQPDYIKNKPFGDFGTVLTEFIPETTLPFNYSEIDGGYAFNMTPPSDYIKTWNGGWTEAEVVWDGSTYACQAQYFLGIKCVGNVGLMMGGESTGEPFIMMMADAATAGADICSIISLVDEVPEDTSNAETKYHDVSVNIYQKNIVKLPLKYSHRPDWNESDSSNGSYIANRPFFTIPSGSVVVPETTVSCDTSADGDAYYALIDPISDIGAYNYRIEFDGVICEVNGGNGYFVYDDGAVMFQIDPSGVVVSTQGSHTFKITLLEDAVFKIDEKYLPEIKALPEVTTDDDNKVLTVVDGVWEAAEQSEHDWNTLKNKPFYEETYSASCSFATAASIPTVKFTFSNMTGYKVADFTLSQEQLLQSTFTFNVDENTYVFPITTEHIDVTTDDFALLTVEDFPFLVAYRAGSLTYSGLTWNVPKAGIYVCFPTSFTLPGPIDINILCNYVKPVDAKYLPKHLQFGEVEGFVDVLPMTQYDNFWLNSDFGTFCHAIKPYLTMAIGDTYVISWDGNEYECVVQDVSAILGAGAVGLGNGTAFGYLGNNEPFMIVNETSGYLAFVSLTDTEAGGSHTIGIATNGIVIEKIDAKYLPDDIGGSSLPEVTTDNNGQVMTVVDGTWVAQAITHPTELPYVTTSDNDKVLKVVNGAWCAQTITHPVELPTVTTDDVGKFLRVGADGTWIVEAIPNAEEASF